MKAIRNSDFSLFVIFRLGSQSVKNLLGCYLVGTLGLGGSAQNEWLAGSDRAVKRSGREIGGDRKRR